MIRSVLLCAALTFCVARSLQDSHRLNLILESLDKGLEYMENHKEEINLDAVFGTRLIEEQLQAFLKFEADVFGNIRDKVEELQERAATIADEGQEYVRINEPDYYATVGALMKQSRKLIWYPSREIDPEEIVKPKPCSQSAFNETASDICLMNIMGTSDSKKKDCIMSDICEEMNTVPNQRGYVLTHQILYWQLLEAGECISTAPPHLQINFCSNVMRDARAIVRAKFPLDHRDLFMEQIGLCGMWGFRDFHKPEWLDNILEWQMPSGCFTHRKKYHCRDNLVPDAPSRIKRREKTLDDGCLSHKTIVALLAITVSLRFEAEIQYY